MRANEEVVTQINPLNAELNPIRHLLALVGARHIVHVSRIRVKEAAVSSGLVINESKTKYIKISRNITNLEQSLSLDLQIF